MLCDCVLVRNNLFSRRKNYNGIITVYEYKLFTILRHMFIECRYAFKLKEIYNVQDTIIGTDNDCIQHIIT